jgi:RimJ/RimL family protein N-acetyltransferase
MKPMSRDARLPKRDLRFDCGKYFLRTIRREDASERWAGWMSDPWTIAALNLPPRQLQKPDIVAYLRGFDQRAHILLGVFEKSARRHVGIVRVDLDPSGTQGFVNVLIGEPEHRHKGLLAQIALATLDYCFERAGLARMTASTLQRNQSIVRFLRHSGWTLDAAKRQQVTSAADGGALDLCTFTLTRDAWRAYTATATAQRMLRRMRRVSGGAAANSEATAP